MKQLIGIISCLLSLNISAQKVLLEEEFLQAVKQYHPVAKRAALEVRIAAANVTASRGGFDPVLQMDDYNKKFDGTTYYDDNIASIKIPTWYGADLYIGSETLNGNRLNPEETKGTIRYVGINMPLVKNLLMDKRRAALQQAKLMEEQSVWEQKATLNDLLNEALQAYWNWWRSYQIHRFTTASLHNATRRYQMVQSVYPLGDRPAIDTMEAFTTVQSIQLQQMEAYTSLLKAQLELSTFLWQQNNTPYDLPNDVQPAALSINESTSLQAVLDNAASHPELISYRYKLQSLQVEKKLKFQGLLPAVDVKYNQMARDYGKAINGPWFQNNFRYGVSVAVPLRLSEGRGAYKAATFKIQQTVLEQSNKQLLLQNKVKQYFIEWQQTTQQLQQQQSLVSNYTTLQRGEETRFANGESTLFIINNREQKTIEAQQKLIELQAKNKIALIKTRWAAGLYGM